jgi:hypothetical protein
MKNVTNRRCNHCATSSQLGEDGFETGVSTVEILHHAFRVSLAAATSTAALTVALL